MAHTVSSDGRTIRILGSITEESDFDALLKIMPDTCSLDLAGVLRINSSGVRRWLTFVRAIPAHKQVTLERCPVLFVAQLNMIAGFSGAAAIRSVLVPLICTACESSSEEVVELSRPDLKTFNPKRQCIECGAPVELDADPAAYFAFVGS